MLYFYRFCIGTLRIIRGILIVLFSIKIAGSIIEVFTSQSSITSTSVMFFVITFALLVSLIYGLKFFANYLHRLAHGKDSTPPISSFFSF
jgi:hypothetical protein